MFLYYFDPERGLLLEPHQSPSFFSVAFYIIYAHFLYNARDDAARSLVFFFYYSSSRPRVCIIYARAEKKSLSRVLAAESLGVGQNTRGFCDRGNALSSRWFFLPHVVRSGVPLMRGKLQLSSR